MKAIVVLVVVGFVGHVYSFSSGVPPIRSVCKSMQPGHDKYKAQTSESIFAISTDTKSVVAGENVEVTLRSVGPTKFIGFYVQARDKNNNPIGMFSTNQFTKVHSCGGIRANAAYHESGKVPKDLVSILWTAPKNYEGDIIFTATMVETYVTFWTNIKAEPVTVKKQ